MDCDGEFGFDTGRVCTKLDVKTHPTGDSDYLASFCFGTGSTCGSEVLSFNKTLKLRAPGVILAKSLDGVSKIPHVGGNKQVLILLRYFPREHGPPSTRQVLHKKNIFILTTIRYGIPFMKGIKHLLDK